MQQTLSTAEYYSDQLYDKTYLYEGFVNITSYA